MKVYVVTFNGYCGGYGADLYLLGVYNTRELADVAVEKAIVPMQQEDKHLIDCMRVNEMEVDNTLDIKYNGTGEVAYTSGFIGGYIE